jgi:hypothetical protein
MDSFLQLVPIGNDDGNESTLVYGEEELVVSDHINAMHEHLQHQVVDQSELLAQPVPISGDEFHRSDSDQLDQDFCGDDHDNMATNHAASFDEQEYMKCVRNINTEMEASDIDIDEKIQVMCRIKAISDPIQLLSEFLLTVLEERPFRNTDVVSKLLECAKQMNKREDAEIALIAAFIFVCDCPISQNKSRTAILPIITALLEMSQETSDIIHPFFNIFKC